MDGCDLLLEHTAALRSSVLYLHNIGGKMDDKTYDPATHDFSNHGFSLHDYDHNSIITISQALHRSTVVVPPNGCEFLCPGFAVLGLAGRTTMNVLVSAALDEDNSLMPFACIRSVCTPNTWLCFTITIGAERAARLKEHIIAGN
jgi:hypothetical protein